MGWRDWLRPAPTEPPEIPTRTVLGITLPDTDPKVMAAWADEMRRWREAERRRAVTLQNAPTRAQEPRVAPTPTPQPKAPRPRMAAPALTVVAPLSPALTPERDADDTPWLATPAPWRQTQAAAETRPGRDPLDATAEELLAWLRVHQREGSLYVLAKRWGWGRPGVHEEGAKRAIARLRERGDIVKDGKGGSPLRLARP